MDYWIKTISPIGDKLFFIEKSIYTLYRNLVYDKYKNLFLKGGDDYMKNK